jgi:hypothetical protein
MHAWAELLTGPAKKYGWEYEMGQKDKRMNTGRLKRKGNKNREGILCC